MIRSSVSVARVAIQRRFASTQISWKRSDDTDVPGLEFAAQSGSDAAPAVIVLQGDASARNQPLLKRTV